MGITGHSLEFPQAHSSPLLPLSLRSPIISHKSEATCLKSPRSTKLQQTLPGGLARSSPSPQPVLSPGLPDPGHRPGGQNPDQFLRLFDLGAKFNQFNTNENKLQGGALIVTSKYFLQEGNIQKVRRTR